MILRKLAFVSLICLLALAAGCQKNDNVSLGTINKAEQLPPDTALLWVRGMGCPQCANNVDLQLLKVPGVENVSIDMGTGKVFAKLSPTNPPTREQLAQAIDDTGFTLAHIQME